MKLSELFLKYETDKNLGFMNIGHFYGEFYDQLFSQYKDGSDILEIGVQKGGSLLVWKDYFPKSKVYGIDIEDTRKPEYISDRVTFILGDFRKVRERLNDLKFDIIIDDGSHILDDVIFTVQNYLQLLKPKGTLVIEDVQEPVNWDMAILPLIPDGYIMEAVDLRDKQNRYDDYLLVIKKV